MEDLSRNNLTSVHAPSPWMRDQLIRVSLLAYVTTKSGATYIPHASRDSDSVPVFSMAQDCAVTVLSWKYSDSVFTVKPS
jgi:hypothetical protein